MKGSERIGNGKGRRDEKREAAKGNATKGMKRRIHKKNVNKKKQKNTVMMFHACTSICAMS